VRRRLALLALAPALAVLTTACNFHLIVPDGKAPLRYRDDVFTEVTKTSDIAYGKAADMHGVQQILKLDIYEPAGDTVTERPVMIYVHGGSFSSLDKSSAEIADEANVLAKKGYVVASIDYRLADTGCDTIGDECIAAIADAWHDAQAAVRFFRRYATTYKIDTQRIGIGGSSAGAITALNVAYGSDVHGGSGNPGYSAKVEAAVSLSGAAIETNPDPGEPPALLFHGTADNRVPYDWAKSTTIKAQRAHLQVELQTWDGDGHVPYVKRRQEILDGTVNFLYWMLDLKNAAH
jgi:acetyl esterase/lipase